MSGRAARGWRGSRWHGAGRSARSAGRQAGRAGAVIAMNSTEKPRMTKADARLALLLARAEDVAQPSHPSAPGRSFGSPVHLVHRRFVLSRPAHRIGPGVVPLCLGVLRRLGRHPEAEIIEACGRLASTFGPRFGISKPHHLRRGEGLQVEMPLGQCLDAVRPVEELPFGLEHRDGVALALQVLPASSGAARSPASSRT